MEILDENTVQVTINQQSEQYEGTKHNTQKLASKQTVFTLLFT